MFCGASDGSSPVYMEAAADLGKEMARRKIGLVYGGGSVGLTGVIARTVCCPYAGKDAVHLTLLCLQGLQEVCCEPCVSLTAASAAAHCRCSRASGKGA